MTMPAPTGDALRARCADLVEEIRGAATDDDAIDSAIAVLTQLQAARLTREDRTGLAAVMGYELGVEEGLIEVANIRRLLERHGVRPCDRQGVVRTTVAMVEDVLVDPGARGRAVLPHVDSPPA